MLKLIFVDITVFSNYTTKMIRFKLNIFGIVNIIVSESISLFNLCYFHNKISQDLGKKISTFFHHAHLENMHSFMTVTDLSFLPLSSD